MPKPHLFLSAIVLLTLLTYANAAASCQNSKLKDGEADLILKEINEARTKVRRGEQRNGYSGKNLPAAISLPDLVDHFQEWSCELEEEAYQYMDGICTGANKVDLNGKATITHGDYEEFFIPRILNKHLTAADFTELKSVEGGNVVYSAEGEIKGFANLMRAEATGIGCARYGCPDPQAPQGAFYAMVCLTDQQDIKETDIIYEAITEPNACPANAYISNSVRKAFLNWHNTLRTLIAIGVVANGETESQLKPATNMPKLVSLNDKLKRTDTRMMVTQCWWSELKNSSGLEESEYIYYGNQNINRFAKIASDLTTKIGCAVYDCTSFVNVVCHYDTTLGHGKPLYAAGLKCGECLKDCANGLCPYKAPGVDIWK
ncbi:SCP-like protein [Oesophagostomum dentatum]|uniref:SCP-like protein n=1 Tax=Oesophagostomum dentatum TaxID=61180 RepID=A0A0B1TLM8_OESDE|nr:SCP-like protein [Oesophagostomum dentatum]